MKANTCSKWNTLIFYACNIFSFVSVNYLIFYSDVALVGMVIKMALGLLKFKTLRINMI